MGKSVGGGWTMGWPGCGFDSMRPVRPERPQFDERTMGPRCSCPPESFDAVVMMDRFMRGLLGSHHRRQCGRYMEDGK
jgi:hypothetical protein